MASLQNQYVLGEEIKQSYNNYRKDGADRKSKIDYFKKKLKELEDRWSDFQFNHDQLLGSISQSDEYFTKRYFDTIKDCYKDYKNCINIDYKKLNRDEEKQQTQGTILNPLSGGSGNQYNKENKQDDDETKKSTGEKGSFSKMDELKRRQEANFKAFSRTVDNIEVDEMTDKWEFEDALRSLETRWSALDSLNLEIDSEMGNKDYEYEAKFSRIEIQYIVLKKQINKKMWAVSHREKSTPKLDIPIFSGNFTQWVSFKDLFNEAIHENPTLSLAQKMQFLKSKVRGEPEKLIQHLPISSDNYQTCWEILNRRYNNERQIFTSHMNILFNIPTMQQCSLSQIKKLHDTAVESLHAIKNLGVDIRTWDPILVHILTQKLDAETYADYVESVKCSRTLPILRELLDYLESKFTVMETSSRRKQETFQQKSNNQTFQHNRQSNSKPKYFNNYPTNNGNGNTISKSFYASGVKCPLCKNDHGIYNCKFFLQMPNVNKLATINRLKVCENCLFSHNGKQCNSTKTCRKCPGKHNTLIHDALQESKPGQTVAISSEQGTSTSQASQGDNSEVLLATAQLKVKSADGTYHIMRALIDQGSQISIITERAAQVLGIKREKCMGVVFGVGQRENNCKGKFNINCASIYNDYTFNTEVIIMSHLINNLPTKTFSKPSWSNIQNINLADPEFYISRPIDLLLGANIYTNIILEGIIKGNDATQPMAQQTQLGWLLCGSAQTFQCNVIINNIEDIQQFWEVEDITEEKEMSSEDIYCMEYFQKTTKRQENGQYEVRLPMKANFEKQLGTSKSKAIAQLHNQEQRLKRQEKLAIAYKTFMNEYRDLNHMKLDDTVTSVHCYLPHHGVERAESTTTKYRVVFNASSKTSTGCSLNDLMYKGPNLQQDLQSLLLKWRQYQYAFTADIEKMYRQILINENDQPLQKIVWRESPEQPIQSFQLTTVTYGTKAAPFIAMMTLKKLAEDERNNFPKAAKVLEESFYMDDLVHGVHSIKQGTELVKELTNLLKTGGFNLRKWSSNENEILKNITGKENKSDDSMIFNFKTDNTSRTLGLCWNPEKDELTFKCELTEQKSKLTKRVLLSEISKIFDPLGWLAPVTIKMKLIFQKVWKSNIQWDQEITDEIKKEWAQLRADINKINDIKIQRWILCNEHDVIELHGFCDASMEAYGAVIYARIKNTNNVVLVAAKTKVVPLKKTLTLPRLELCGAHLLSKLMEKVKQSLNRDNIETYGWTDSKVVLGWLQGEPNRWKPFVANRVRQITEVMPEQQWRYVRTDENPADAASRGQFPSQLKDNSLWWSAPAWLTEFEAEKSSKPTFNTNEERKLGQTMTVQQSQGENIIDDLLTKHSSFYKITRIVAWIKRALTLKHKHEQRTSYLTLQEIRNAKLTIIKHVQKTEYGAEINQLRKHGNVETKSKLINLNPFIDENNILRVGGRLSQASISFEMKHPKIIPRNSRLAELLINQGHQLTLHGGPRLTLANLRQEYWITGGNNTVKKQLRKCITCRKQEGKRQVQLMGDLPAARSNIASPFYHTGVDYTGFVDVKTNKGRGVKTTKGYVAIFICMVTKAVHLELVSDLSSSAFLAALRRMAARKGTPCHMYSDNGTNFVGANRALRQEWEELKQVFDDSFLTEITEMNIEWHFNAPAWPSAGGLWERAVRSLKHHLRRVVGDQKLTFEEYSTVLTQIEACLNSRPLCPITENIEDLDFLTPAHFLTGRPGVTVIETEEDARTRWHLTQKLFNDIWKKWKTEYLSQLTTRQKWKKTQSNIEVGDMVVVHEDNLPPGKWALGRVVEVHPGRDGLVRVVTLKTKNGFMKRPVVKLSLLPLEKQTNEVECNEQTDEGERPRTGGGRKNHSNFAAILFMCIALINIFVPALGFQVTTLNEKQAFYFDRITNIQLIRDEWKIIAYYDMSPYWEGTEAYEKYYEQLDKTCNIIKHLAHCDILMLQLGHLDNELQHNNRILLNQQQSTRARRRRGLINGVGYLANSLFGVLDDHFAEQYEKDIGLVKDNQKHLAQLWRNQTTIVEAEYNLLKRTEDMMQKQHKIINKHLIKLDNLTNILVNKVNEVEYTTEFTLSAMTANNILTHLKNIQDTLLDTVTNVYNGKINIHLIDPQQLQNQLSIISSQLAKELTLPIENIQTSMLNIYQLLKVKARVTSKYLIFEIKVPLISRDSYELYNIQSVPQQIGKNMAIIAPIESYVAMNLQKDAYLPITQLELQHCLFRDVTTSLCQLKTPIYKMKSDKDLCIRDENILEQCKMTITTCQNKWISLAKINQYLYFCCNQCQLRTICSDQVTAHQLTGTNIINIKNSCSVKTENFTIYTHKQQENKIELNYNIEVPVIAPINNIINITIDPMRDESVNDITHDQAHKELEENIKVLKQSDALEDNLSVHDVHHYTSIWGLWSILVIGAIVLFYRRARRCASRQEPSATEDASSSTSSAGAAAAAAAVLATRPRSSARNIASEQRNTSESETVNMPKHKDRSTSPVLRKIAFNDDS